MENNKYIYAVIGYPLDHSMSPIIHNAAFQELGLEYSFKAVRVKYSEEAIKIMLKNNYRGYSVTMPHKISIMEFLDDIDPLAKKIGAINTITNTDGYLIGYNTDVIGAINSIKEVMDIENRKVVLIGAGGAARAIAIGLKEYNAEILIQNRTIARAKSLAKDVECDYSKIDQELLVDYDLIINTTPVGMYPNYNESVVDNIPKNCVVQDIVYNPIETKFLKIAKAAGCKIINGTGMFLYQAAEQFRLFTGKEAPLNTMKKALFEELS